MNVVRQVVQAAESAVINHGVNLVRKTISSSTFPQSFKIQQLYAAALKVPPPSKFTPAPLLGNPAVKPPHLEHPICSIKFLKKSILPILEGRGEIKVVRRPRQTLDAAEEVKDTKAKSKSNATQGKHEFVYQTIQDRRPKPPTPKAPKPVVGTEVGVGMDFSHLNKRRQASRLGKITREVNQMKELRNTTAVVPS